MVLYKYCLCFTEVFPDIKNEVCFFGYLNGTSFSVSIPIGCSSWHSLKPEGLSSENSHILCMFSVEFWQYCFVHLRSSCCRKFCSSCRHVLHSSCNNHVASNGTEQMNQFLLALLYQLAWVRQLPWLGIKQKWRQLFLLVTASLDVSWNHILSSVLRRILSAVKCTVETELQGKKISSFSDKTNRHVVFSLSSFKAPSAGIWWEMRRERRQGKLWHYHFWSPCQTHQLKHWHLWLFRS